MTVPQDVIGVDVAKGWIDIFTLSSRKYERIFTTKQALARFATTAAGAMVVCEASGGDERPLIEALAKAGVACARVNPRQAREFAHATGRLARTDRVDAEALARMRAAISPEPTSPVDPGRARLAELVARRDGLVASIGREKSRARTTADIWITRDIAQLLRAPQAHLKAVEGQIATQIDACAALAGDQRRLITVPGIGPALSAALIAHLPELGQLDHRGIVSLAGLAPHACDSGTHRDKRRVWDGRADVRRTLSLAAFIANRYDLTIRTFRKRLQDAGKPAKTAITACACKLLTILNAMLRNKQDYRNQAV